ncbi:MAG: efflux RND transporter periplasmic adaptor subunit [Gammaproteobacteria bacterium]|nr:efflux RND transporter periplasmic adaptor subunit [Gammaproteobacteria bacterium]
MNRAVRRMTRGVALGLAGVVAACSSSAEAGDTIPPIIEGATRVINVEVEPIAPTGFTELIRLTGTVRANRDVVVSATEPGLVASILVDQGSPVRAGQAVARLDDTQLRAQVDEARARADLARETWERYRRLFEEDQVGSELQYLEARYTAEQSAASLTALSARLDATVIRAPFEGVLDSRDIELGSMIMPGTPVARVVDLDPVRIRGGVPERFALDVRPGSEATVTFQVLEGEIFEGDITYVGAAVDPEDRTFPVELTLANPGGLIKPEMVANIEIVRETRTDVVVVPREVLLRVEDGYVAYVVEGAGDDGVARMREVELGPAQRNLVVIEEGLRAGDRLVVIGQQLIADGDRVRVVN